MFATVRDAVCAVLDSSDVDYGLPSYEELDSVQPVPVLIRRRRRAARIYRSIRQEAIEYILQSTDPKLAETQRECGKLLRRFSDAIDIMHGLSNTWIVKGVSVAVHREHAEAFLAENSMCIATCLACSLLD
jgi:hypothetical protein